MQEEKNRGKMETEILKTKLEFKENGEPKLVEDYENEEKQLDQLKEVFKNLEDIYRYWVDLPEPNYTIIPLWVIGTYFHDNFISFPHLYFNAMKGSGKSRIINLTTYLSKDGIVLNSPTEAVLFRTTGTLGIDEFESLSEKGKENVRELINNSYKKGAKVRRLKKVKVNGAEEQRVEEFDIYRPIVMSNIYGIENVTSDRCITLILEKSNKSQITNLVECFQDHFLIQETLKILKQCSLCSVVMSPEVYKGWNDYLKSVDVSTLTTSTTYNTYNTLTTLYTKLKDSGLNGRNLELTFPLLLIAYKIDEELFEKTLEYLKEIIVEKIKDDYNESKDIMLYDFVSQVPEQQQKFFYSLNEITNDFKKFSGSNEEWVNSKWIGRALKRLNLIIQKRRISAGMEVILNIQKAQEKIKMFRGEKD